VADNPKLTVRMTDSQMIKHPLRVVLSKTADLPLNAVLFNDKTAKTIVFTSYLADKQTLYALIDQGVECVEVALNKDHELDLYEVLKILAAKEISSVLIEGGQTLLNAFFSANLVNEVQAYIAPVIISEFRQKVVVNIKEMGFLKADYYCIAEME
jgi:diaminohydroxyphosphoribosylaminopyrimidine deaminase/5-amino-6-(5-phosphoribosylamino)uracil reductase